MTKISNRRAAPFIIASGFIVLAGMSVPATATAPSTTVQPRMEGSIPQYVKLAASHKTSRCRGKIIVINNKKHCSSGGQKPARKVHRKPCRSADGKVMQIKGGRACASSKHGKPGIEGSDIGSGG